MSELFPRFKKATEEEVYRAGESAGLSGPDQANTHFRFFLSAELTQSWERGRKTGELLGETEISFGKHIGKRLVDASVPDDYIAWMTERGGYRDPDNRFEATWQVPIVLMVLARREMERRGYKLAESGRFEQER